YEYRVYEQSSINTIITGQDDATSALSSHDRAVPLCRSLLTGHDHGHPRWAVPDTGVRCGFRPEFGRDCLGCFLVACSVAVVHGGLGEGCARIVAGRGVRPALGAEFIGSARGQPGDEAVVEHLHRNGPVDTV